MEHCVFIVIHDRVYSGNWRYRMGFHIWWYCVLNWNFEVCIGIIHFVAAGLGFVEVERFDTRHDY